MSKNKNYNHKISETKWQQRWEEEGCFKFDEDSSKEKYYVLEMFPYPSGKIHMGHLRNYAIGDVVARYKKMKGYNVLHPMGFDSFGLPAENAALEHKIHPRDWTLKNIETMKKELKSIGLSIDWSRELATCLPEYYKHEQKIFLDFVKNGLAYQKESYVNWDPVDQTVLANEQVIDGRGWRSGALVEKKKLKQWFLKVSEFSQELLDELKNLKGWDERVISMQEKWIGRSEGCLLNFELTENDLGEEFNKVEVYTTRPETLFGASFVGIAANHPLALEIAKKDEKAKEFIEKCNQTCASEEVAQKQEKEGYDTGFKVKHPFVDGLELNIYIANFVLMDYGTGAIFACPAHDERDFEFAKKYDLDIKKVVDAKDPFDSFEGKMIDSDFLNNLSVKEAKKTIIEKIEEGGFGKKQINYKLRDWGVSRQRYWGCPIPMLYLEDGSVVAEEEKNLPVELPDDVTFDGKGNPLAKNEKWKNTTYKGQKATRETDTFDTFFESSWYFLRYISALKDKAFDKDKVNKFMPVDQYVGGVEHAVLHLLYARFFVKALKKCGYLDFNEPFKNLLTQGMVCHKTYKDEDGSWVMPKDVAKSDNGDLFCVNNKKKVKEGRSEKMSKSKKNVVEPSKIIDAYGSDTARLFMLSDSPVNRDLEWSDSGIDGCWKYVNRVWRLVSNVAEHELFNELENSKKEELTNKQKEIVHLSHKTIFEVGQEFERMGFNVVIAKIREFSNALEKFEVKDLSDLKVKYEAVKDLVLLLGPIMPHLAEEAGDRLGIKDLICEKDFPKFDQSFIKEESAKIAVQVKSKLRAVIEVDKNLTQEEVEKIAKSDENVAKHLQGANIKKVIFVKDRLLNFVV